MVVNEIHSFFIYEDRDTVEVEFTVMDDDFESTHTLEILFEELDELCDLFEEVDWYDYDEYEEDNHLQIQRKINPLELKEGLTILINQNTHLIR